MMTFFSITERPVIPAEKYSHKKKVIFLIRKKLDTDSCVLPVMKRKATGFRQVGMIQAWLDSCV